MSGTALRKAMILAAGYGTRLKPLTDKIPKALIMHKGSPMLKNVIDKLTGSGIEEIIINTHYHASQIEDYIKQNSFNAEIKLVFEKEILGTGGAVKNAGPYLKGCGSFLVYNVDVDSEIDLKDFYSLFPDSGALACLAVKNRRTSRFLLIDSDGNVAGRTENGIDVLYNKKIKKYTKTAFCGIQILSDKILDKITEFGNFDLIPVYMRLIETTNIIKFYDLKSTYWKDLGKIQDYI